MVDTDTFRQLALSYEEAVEQPHFVKLSFRVNKRIFATLNVVNQKASLKLSEIDQSVFCSFDKSIIYPATGTWGKQGWTIIELTKIKTDMLKDALTCSYCNTAPERLSAKYKLK